MTQSSLSILVFLFACTPVFGHFVYIVPQSDGKTLQVVFSETLEEDPAVSLGPIAKLQLLTRGATGADTALDAQAHDHSMTARAPVNGIVHGTITYGISTRGGQPFLLKYHPKAILGSIPADRQSLGNVELVPTSLPQGLRFQVLSQQKPVAQADVTVLLPDNTSKKVTTDAEGWTPRFEAPGRYGAWARVVEKSAGEHEGQKYTEIRHYPTLVTTHSPFPKLPEAVSSFGAAVSGDWVYVYGGHRAKVHAYDTEAVTGAWRRFNWKQPGVWEELPAGPPMQGMALTTHDGKLIRVGGMTLLNAPGEKADHRSSDSCAIFDPQNRTWQPLPALPKPRSSHDAVVVGSQLIVVGGWNMRGNSGNDWFNDALALDLKHPDQGWRAFEQPFRRRALQAAVYQGKVYVVGGLAEDGSVINAVEVYDPAKQSWSRAAELPGDERNGFSPGVCTLGNHLYVSMADGIIARLSADGKQWESVARISPRIVHRMVPAGEKQLIVLGGAHRGENLDAVEAVRP